MNVFVGENLGNNVFRMGIMCLIGIAHLPEHLEYIEYKDSFDIKPGLKPNIGRQVHKILMNTEMVPSRALPIIGNLIHSLKVIASKALPQMTISGNVKFDDPYDIRAKKKGGYGGFEVQSYANMDADTGISNKDMTLMMNQSYFSGSHLLKKTE